MITNLYSIDDKDLVKSIYSSVIHFTNKYQLQPETILIHPDLVNGLEGERRCQAATPWTSYRRRKISQ